MTSLFAPPLSGISRRPVLLACTLGLLLITTVLQSRAVVLWSDSGATLVHETGAGKDILGGAVKRDDSASDTLYFKFHVSPLSDGTTEEYFAAFELFEGDTERLGIGNALRAWAYSAFLGHNSDADPGRATGYVDLRSSKPDSPGHGPVSNFEVPRRGTERTIVFKVQYVAGGDDLVTVWLNPDLGPGANEVYQPESLITRFNANATFDEIRLRHGGGGPGWTFSDMAIATSFSDFADSSSAKPSDARVAALSFSFQSWQREQGLPLGAVRALTQTRDGYLWIGSDDGLARFDGVRFTIFEPTKGRPAAGVRALLGDRQGALWIGTADRGLIQFAEGKVTFFVAQDGLPSTNITALAEGRPGQIWVGTDTGLSVWNQNRFSQPAGLEALAKQPISALCSDSAGDLWLGVRGEGVFRWHEGTLSRIGDASIAELLREPRCILVDREGRIWIGAGDDFVLCNEADQWRRYRIARHSTQRYISALAEEPDGTVWAGSVGEGLFQFKEGRMLAVNASRGLSDNLVKSLLVDREGKLWVGTDSGLNRLRRKNLLVFSQDEGLGLGAVRGLAEVAPGVIWAAKPGDGLYRWEGRTFSRLNASGIQPRDPQLGALLVARDGSCWVACKQGVLRFKDPQAVADESRIMGLTNLATISLAEDSGGHIWAGTREGQLWRLDQGKWTQATNLWGNHAVAAIASREDGSLWIGTEGSGVYRLGPDGNSHFDKPGGLASDSIRSLSFGSDDCLWIGTAGGLNRIKDGRITTWTVREGLPDNTISQILEDNSGRVWLGCNRGIVCLIPGEMEVVSGAAQIPSLRVYGRSDGMPSEECSGSFSPAGLMSKSGLLWFSTSSGIAVADPQHHPTNSLPPTVVIEEVLVDGAPRPMMAPGQQLRIGPGRHRLEVQYTGLGFDALDHMRFRYRLEALDPGWVDAGTRRSAFYDFVPPGQYRFRVAVSGGGGQWNESGPEIALSVSQHFWQRGWVISVAAVGLLALAGGIVRVVEKRKSQRHLKLMEQERALERERTRIARDLHDEMGAKLCRISFLSEHARRENHDQGDMREQISTIADASRELLHSLDEIVWAVNPHNDTLEHVASYIGQYAQNYFHGTGLECELDIPEQFPPHPIASQERHHLFLAVHEAFTNILKHSGATQVKVSMRSSGTSFEIRTLDNGRGFIPPGVNGKSNHGPTVGDGLRNMRQRLESMGGQCHMESGSGTGTTISFVLPLKQVLSTKGDL